MHINCIYLYIYTPHKKAGGLDRPPDTPALNGILSLMYKNREVAELATSLSAVVPLGVEPRTHGFSVHCSTT